MRFQLLFFCGITAALAVPFIENVEEAGLEDPVADLINKTLNAIIQNISDPLTPNDIHIKFSHSGILTGFLNSSEILVNGLSKAYASVITVDEKKKLADITLNVHNLIGNFEYTVDALAMDLVPLYGSGNINVVIRDLSIAIRVPTSLDNFKNATFLFNIGSSVFNTQGILNNPEFSALLNTALNDNFAIFVNHNNKVISKLIVLIIQKISGEERYSDDGYFALDSKDFML
nr:unnamed protein product [Callosobruchus chinensis]